MFGGFNPFDMMQRQMEEMDALMNSMVDPFGMFPGGVRGRQGNPRQQMIDDGINGNRLPNRHVNDVHSDRNNRSLMPFGGNGLFGGGPMNLFGNNVFGGGMFDNMFRQMEAFRNDAANNPNSVVYSETKVFGMAPDASGNMRSYESSDSVRKHGDLKETRRTLRDSSRGLEEMSIGHHIGERGHVIEKKRINGGSIEEDQQFFGIDPNNARAFDSEWTHKTQDRASSGRYQLHDDNRNLYLPIENKRSERREGGASPYGRSSKNYRRKNKGPIIEEPE